MYFIIILGDKSKTMLRNNMGNTILGSAPEELLFVSKNSIGSSILSNMQKQSQKNKKNENNERKEKMYSVQNKAQNNSSNGEFSNTSIVKLTSSCSFTFRILSIIKTIIMELISMR